MKLEEIADRYGMIDYYDMYTGYTYHLSRAKKKDDGKLSVPVSMVGVGMIGFATMENVKNDRLQ